MHQVVPVPLFPRHGHLFQEDGVFSRPMYAGNAIATVQAPFAKPQVCERGLCLSMMDKDRGPYWVDKFQGVRPKTLFGCEPVSYLTRGSINPLKLSTQVRQGVDHFFGGAIGGSAHWTLSSSHVLHFLDFIQPVVGAVQECILLSSSAKSREK